MTNKLLLFFLLIMLVGCMSSNIQPDYTFSNRPGNGVLVMSASYSPAVKNILFHYRMPGSLNPTLYPISRKDSSEPDDWSDPSGQLFAVELPAGMYEIVNWRLQFESRELGPTKLFSIPFSIPEGKAVYIGNIHFNFQKNGDTPGALVTYKMSISDKSDRDLTLFANRYKNIQNSELIKNITSVR